MTRRRWVVATGNPAKLRELRLLLAGIEIDLVPQTALGVEPAEETAPTFVENALLKARHAAAVTGLPAIADDSGLAVDALEGAPGVRSARFAGPGAADEDNVRLLLEKLRNVPDHARAAHFRCVLVALGSPTDPAPLIAQGVWHGLIAHAPSGSGGFGYDPVFTVPDEGMTAAELPAEIKNRLSHRARAMRALEQCLRGPADVAEPL